MRPSGGGKTRITFSAPSRGLIGYHGEFLSDTRGTGIMNRLFEKYGPHKGKIEGRKNGVLISNGTGEANAYALGPLEERGILMVGARRGALRGHDRRRERQDGRPRGQSDEGEAADQLPRVGRQGRRDPPDPAASALTLEQAIAYIDDDELVEVTPKTIRLRKRYLDPNERKRAKRAAA